MNWIIKQIFYFKYFIQHLGCNLLSIPKQFSFLSISFKDYQWNEYLEWYVEKKELQDWNTYKYKNLASTVKGFSQLYGKWYFCVRLDGEIGKQIPALWLLNLDDDHYYEIDIELFEKDFAFTIHWNHTGKQDKSDPNYHFTSSHFGNKKLWNELRSRIHLFVIDWTKKWIRFYIDGLLTAKFKNYIHTPMSMILSKCSMSKVIIQP